MRAARRHDLSPRLEIMPLIDVIFLLLTFFIYSLVTMVRAEVLPVQLQTLSTGEAAEPTKIVAVTIDASGALYWNRAPIEPDALDEKLDEVAAQEDRPTLFLAMEEVSVDPSAPGPPTVDRGPLLISLIERVRRAGLAEFNIVGDRESE